MKFLSSLFFIYIIPRQFISGLTFIKLH